MSSPRKQALMNAISALTEAEDDEARALALKTRLAALLREYHDDPDPIIDRDVAVLLIDIRGFTALTEAYPPAQLARSLNAFLTQMAHIIAAHGGYVDKFMGDAILALFGIPELAADTALQAARCAIAMQQRLAELNAHAAPSELPRLYAGISLNYGQAMVGSFGGGGYYEFTAIGDTVNVASRILGYALRGQVLLGDGIHTRLRTEVAASRYTRVKVKGKLAPIAIYSLQSIHGEAGAAVPIVESRRSPRIVALMPAEIRNVDGKRIALVPFAAQVRDLAYDGLCIETDHRFSRHAEVLVGIGLDRGQPTMSELYARVVRSWQVAGKFRVSLEITSLDTPAHLRLREFIDAELWNARR